MDAPGVTLANLGGYGYVGVQDTAGRFTAEDVYLTHALDGGLPAVRPEGRVHGRVHGLGPAGEDGAGPDVPAVLGRAVVHHGFSLNLAGASEGGGFANVLYDQCHAIAPARAGGGGSGTGPAASTSPTPATSSA